MRSTSGLPIKTCHDVAIEQGAVGIKYEGGTNVRES